MWKEVFKVGKHTDANGNEREWSQEDLDIIVEKYNNQLPDDRHEAPVVIGHPVNNSPAYAWVKELKRDGDILLAKFAQIDPQFEKLIKEGKYKKVSIALYPDMMLRHVGFLGAVPPAVKGLKDSEFNEDKQFISFDLDKNTEKKLSDSYANAEQTHNNSYAIKGKESKRNIYNSSPSKFDNFEEGRNQSDTNQKSINFQGGIMPENYTKLFQELLVWLGETFNEEIASQTAAQLEALKTKYVTSQPDNSNQGGIQDVKTNPTSNTDTNNASQKNDNSKFEDSKEFKELQSKLEILEKDNREMKFNEYFKSQSGRLVPAQKQIVKLAFEVAGKNTKGYVFSEEGKQTQVNGEEIIRKLIDSFPAQVEFNEIAKKELFGSKEELDDQNKYIEEYNKSKN